MLVFFMLFDFQHQHKTSCTTVTVIIFLLTLIHITGGPAFVCRSPHCDELRSHIAGCGFSGLSESQQASLRSEGEQRDPVGVHVPLGSAHPQQLLLIHQGVDLNSSHNKNEKQILLNRWTDKLFRKRAECTLLIQQV